MLRPMSAVLHAVKQVRLVLAARAVHLRIYVEHPAMAAMAAMAKTQPKSVASLAHANKESASPLATTAKCPLGEFAVRLVKITAMAPAARVSPIILLPTKPKRLTSIS